MTAFAAPITWKTMNMCACDIPRPSLPPGEMIMVRTRQCNLDPSGGDMAAQYATRQLPRWGMPAYVPALKPLTKKSPDAKTVVQLPSFNPAVQKTIQKDKTYADKNSWRMPTQSFIEHLEQNKRNPFAITIDRKLTPEPTVLPVNSLGGNNGLVTLFTPKSNLNSKYEIGTEALPFARSPHYPWVKRPPYVRFGAGVYDPTQEYQSPALYGIDLENQEKDNAAKQFVYSIPLSMLGATAGLIYGINQGSLLKGLLYGGIAGSIPLGYGLHSLKNKI